jgi:hypothetical protein
LSLYYRTRALSLFYRLTQPQPSSSYPIHIPIL